MKILILTQPLHTNYGGLMQAYALQRVLIEMGHDVYTDMPKKNIDSFISKLSIWVPIRFMLKYCLFRNVEYIVPFSLSKKQFKIISQHTQEFVNQNIQTIDFFEGKKKPKKSKIKLFDAYIVGSDQVWRPIYSPNIYSYFLDFVNCSNVKKIAYAASFGTDVWEYDKGMTLKCKKLIANFNAISVRESSAIELCSNYFDIKASLTIDPTFLMSKNDYLKLLESKSFDQTLGELMYYFLDIDDEKTKILNKTRDILQFKTFNSMQVEKVTSSSRINLADCIYPSPLNWINGFKNAKYVVTDSFHGVVFSIIFNVPFIAIGNTERGLSRFTSLLSQFNLEDRLVKSKDEINNDLIFAKIDFEALNIKKNILKEDSLNFLINILK